MLISPLARKLCLKKGIDPATLRGTGPRGRIMAADVTTPATSNIILTGHGKTVISDFATAPTQPEDSGYYVYDNVVNMGALARISLPIAVQCEKLLENRYSLFDFIVRAVVKACAAHPCWLKEGESVRVLLFEDSGKRVLGLENAACKSVYRIAKEKQKADSVVPQGFAPHIVVCDTDTTRQRVIDIQGEEHRPLFGFETHGHSPKTEIRAGGADLRSVDLPYTFYISTEVPSIEANRIAARLGALLYNPVNLLMQN